MVNKKYKDHLKRGPEIALDLLDHLSPDEQQRILKENLIICRRKTKSI